MQHNSWCEHIICWFTHNKCIWILNIYINSLHNVEVVNSYSLMFLQIHVPLFLRYWNPIFKNVGNIWYLSIHYETNTCYVALLKHDVIRIGIFPHESRSIFDTCVHTLHIKQEIDHIHLEILLPLWSNWNQAIRKKTFIFFSVCCDCSTMHPIRCLYLGNIAIISPRNTLLYMNFISFVTAVRC